MKFVLYFLVLAGIAHSSAVPNYQHSIAKRGIVNKPDGSVEVTGGDYHSKSGKTIKLHGGKLIFPKGLDHDDQYILVPAGEESKTAGTASASTSSSSPSPSASTSIDTAGFRGNIISNDKVVYPNVTGNKVEYESTDDAQYPIVNDNNNVVYQSNANAQYPITYMNNIGGWSTSNSMKKIGDGKFDIGNANDLEININSAGIQIKVEQGDGADLSFTYEVQSSDSNEKVDDILEFKVTKGEKAVVEIKSKPRTYFGSHQSSIVSTIKLPKSGALKNVKLVPTSGSVTYENKMMHESLTFTGSSGSIIANGWKTKTLTIDAKSASANIDGEADTIIADLSSSSLNGKLKSYSSLDVKCGSCSINSDFDPKPNSKTTIDNSSGSAKINVSKAFAGKFNMKSSSGTLSVTGTDVKLDPSDGDEKKYSMKSKKSGTVREGQSTFDADCRSGNIKVVFE